MPLVRVTKAQLMEGSSIFGDFVIRWWDLSLECGHSVERRVRFPRQTGAPSRGYGAMHHPRSRIDALPAPVRCMCEFCGDAP